MSIDSIGPAGAGPVRIDGTYGVAPHVSPEETEAKAESLPGEYLAERSGNGTEVISSQEQLIAAAVAAGEIDAKAVEEARALLKAGQLDTPQAAERAAEAILEMGL
jgi:phosphosulfolactate phosphohydrolase-like enzyme